ncbi:MAG: hypothetical protein DWQ04_03515 [Chloroflexi bacterium]|nr:MAG: hypothetical protein DWQ04_03515 [Chloroflexota bacterium]
MRIGHTWVKPLNLVLMAWKKWLRESGQPLLLITLLGIPLLTPLMRITAVTCTHDGHLHYHRVAAMRHAWENGLTFTRWLPDLAYGYGYPFFVYREPTPLYAVLGPHLMGIPLPAATNIFYALTILACGWFMFLWVRDVLGTQAGIVSAVAYMSAPYVLVDALIRGNSPESLALPLFPLILWAGRRWLLTSSRMYFIVGVFSLAFLSLSHNISTLIFTPTLLVYLAALAWHHHISFKTTLLRLGLLFALGLGMTIFYTAGALLEMDQVTLEQSTVTRNNDFHYNFTTLGEIFSAVPTEDPLLVNPPLPFRLGWVPTSLAALGIILALATRHSPLTTERRLHVWLMVAGTAVYLFMSLPLSQFVWENVPLIDFAQFPWRFVGRAALPVAVLAGVPFAELTKNNKQKTENEKRITARRLPLTAYRLLFLLAIGLLVVETLPNLYPNVCKEEGFPTINTVHNYERETGLVGVDPEGSYFPRTVDKRPKGSALEVDFQNGRIPQRFDETALPAGATVNAITYHKQGATIELTTPEPFTARYLTFDFPGWVAFVDETAVSITPSTPEGLITFPVPAGTHTIEIRWQSTRLRTTLVIFSLFSLLGVVGVVSIQSLTINNQQLTINNQHKTENGKRKTDYRLLFFLGLGLIAFKFLIIDKFDTPLRRFNAPSVKQAVVLNGGEMRLDGFNVSADVVESGETFDIDMAWTAVSSPTLDYQTNVWLVGPDGLNWSDLNTFRTRQYEDAARTRFWLPGQWGWDSREVAVLSGTPPGSYNIVLTLFDRETLQPVTLSDAANSVVGPTAVIGQITVTESQQVPAFSPQTKVETAVPDTGLTLLGFNQDRDAAQPGDIVFITLFWERHNTAQANNFELQLFNQQGESVKTWQLPLTREDWEISNWQIGERLRGQYLLRLPAGLASGKHQFMLQGGIALGVVDVTAPDRVFEAVEMETAVSTPFHDQNTPITTLTGYTLSPITDHRLPITLLWQSTTETTTSYRIFVHLIDTNGNLIAQSDGEPANWTRPTTGWTPGEYIIDSHTIPLPDSLPDGPLTLRIGLYDPATNGRLTTDFGDKIEIPLNINP